MLVGPQNQAGCEPKRRKTVPDKDKLSRNEKVFVLLVVLIVYNVMLATFYFYDHNNASVRIRAGATTVSSLPVLDNTIAPMHFIDTPPDNRSLIDWTVTVVGYALVVGTCICLIRELTRKEPLPQSDSKTPGIAWIMALMVAGFILSACGSVAAFHPMTARDYDTEGWDAYLGKNYSGSAIAYQRAIDLNPANKMDLADAYFGIGRAFKSMNDKDNAVAALQQYLKVSQSDNGVKFVYAAFKALYDKEQQENRAQAMKWLHDLNSVEH